MAFLDKLLEKIKKPAQTLYRAVDTPQERRDIFKGITTKTIPTYLKEVYVKPAQKFGSLLGGAITAGAESRRLDQRTTNTISEADKNLRLAIELSRRGDREAADRLFKTNRDMLAKTSQSASQMNQDYGQRKRQLPGAAWKFAQALPPVNPLSTGSQLLSHVLSGSLGAATTKPGEDPYVRAGETMARTKQARLVTQFTDPAISLFGSHAKGFVGTKLGQQLAGRLVAGMGNVLEDEILAKVEQETPGATERLMSFAIGAISSSGGEVDERTIKTRLAEELQKQKEDLGRTGRLDKKDKEAVKRFWRGLKKIIAKQPTSSPEVANVKTKPFGLSVKKVSPEEGARLRGELKPTRKATPTELQPLTEEARRYKSAGEFVRDFPDRESFFLSKNLKWQKSLKGFEDLADGDREFARYGNWFIVYDPVTSAKARFGKYTLHNEKGRVVTAEDTLPRAMAKIEKWGGITKSQLNDFYNQATKGVEEPKIIPKTSSVNLKSLTGETPTKAKNLDEILASSGYSPEQIASISTKEKQRIIKENIPPFSHKSFEQVDQQKIPTPETLEPEQIGERVAWSEFSQAEGPKGITRLFNRLFNPLKNAPEEVQQTANSWRREVLTARADANSLAKRFADIPDEDGWKMVRYIQNPTKETAQQLGFNPTQYQKQIKELRQVYDQVREEGLKKGLDIGYLENYLNQVWQEPWGEIATKVRGAGARPYFTKERVIPSYEEGLKLGLTPRFTHPAQLAAHYKEALSKAVANKKLVDGLIKSGYLVPAGDAPLDWQPITAPLFPKVTKTIGKGEKIVSDYKAPPNVAEAINSIFEYGGGQHSGLEELADLGAKVSRAMQEVTLSGGIGPANAFTYGQMIKEVTAGRVKSPVTSFFRAFSDKSTKEFFQNNQQYQRMMAEEGIPLYTSDDYGRAFKNLAENKTLKQKLGEGWDKVFNEATFRRFMPMLEINHFKDTYEEAIKRGLSPDEAKRLAGEATKQFYGIADAFSRSKFVEDTATAVFSAPKFRESMVNFWINNAKALLPKNIKDPSYNTNRKFLAGTVITYLLYTATNKALTGHWMHENKGGKELSVEIPVGDDRSIYVPMLPSVGTLPRRAGEMAGALLEGDVATAAQKAGSFLSQPISLGSQLLSNRTFYGAPIYQQEDTALQKVGKLGGYALEESSHPLIGEPIAVAQGRKTPFEAGLGLMEVPAYPSASTPEKPLPLARVADTQTLATGQPGTLARTTEEEKPSFLESLFSLRKKEEPLRDLPQSTNELAIVYGDARKVLSNYDERRTRIEYGQYTSENKRRQALTELEQERAYAQAVLERIEAEKPEQVFEIGLQTYASGEGMSVEERAEWAAGELSSSADEAEFSQKLDQMLEAGVITKDVATALREEYGLPVYQYKSGGKIVSASGGGSGGGTSKGDLTKILNAIQSDYEATKKLYQSMATPSSQTSALETILKLYGQRGAAAPPTSSSLEKILATRRRMKPIAKIQ